MRLVLTILLALATVIGARPASAQEGAATGSGEIAIKVVQLGLGGRLRPGEWTGVQVELTDLGSTLRDVVVRMPIPDADGDPALWQRVVLPNPGVAQRVWLYARMPFTLDTGTVLEIAAYEAERSDEPGGVSQRTRAGRLLGRLPVAMQGAVSPASPLLATVGRAQMGLRRYAVRLGTGNAMPLGHAPSELAEGLSVPALPDRWLGLAGFEALIWSASGSEGTPGQLEPAQAEAIREWVRRGGHLVVVLPSAGETWTNSAGNPLADLVPPVTIERREGIDLSPYGPLLVLEGENRLPRQGVVQILHPAPGAAPEDAGVILAAPDGAPVVVRRQVGIGAVTLVGLDLAAGRLETMGGVDAEVFWHRVLGRRGSLVSADQVLPPLRAPDYSQREARWFDGIIAREITGTQRPGRGLLLALIVFALYWALAGPVAFAVLRRRGAAEHSWLAFVLLAGVFTGIAWGGATALKARRISVQHLTILDHVYGQDVQRARAWMSVLLPTYGEQELSVRDEPAGTGTPTWRNAIAAWDPPALGLGGGGSTGFPDARGYAVEARSPDTIAVPTRSTVKQVQVDWAGAPAWRMPIPAWIGPAAQDGSPPPPPRLVPAEGTRAWALEGGLVHDLPGLLENVVVMVVRQQDALAARTLPQSPRLLALADAFRQTAPWPAGAVLDLGAATGTPARQADGARRTSDARSYFQTLLGEPRTMRFDELDDPWADVHERLVALSFLNLLEPPAARENPDNSVLALRRATHGLDLSRWFTQPCVIILGELVAAPSPVPLRVDGDGVPSAGRTFVRWVCPLPPDPPRYPSR